MTRDRDFKRLVRARMQATGEPYMVARAWLLRHSAPPRPAGRFRRLAARAREVLASPRRGGPRMHPFERFTDQAKRALQLAQDEATRSGHDYIGTEHVLLGLLRQETGVAARALAALKVEMGPTRARLAQVLGRPVEAPSGRRLPTSRTKRVIEIAFEEARQAGCAYVDTGHVLLGILVEGQGVASVVLREMGVTLGRARDAIAAQPRDGEPQPVALSAAVEERIRRARHIAAGERASEVTVDHLRRALEGHAEP